VWLPTLSFSEIAQFLKDMATAEFGTIAGGLNAFACLLIVNSWVRLRLSDHQTFQELVKSKRAMKEVKAFTPAKAKLGPIVLLVSVSVLACAVMVAGIRKGASAINHKQPTPVTAPTPPSP
jgi:hypothetical protein